MTDSDAHDLGANSRVESSAHMVQDTPSYAAAAKSRSRGPAGVDAAMMSPNNAAAYDLESDPGFVRNWARMSAFGREYRHPNNIMTERPLTRHQNSVREFFQELQNIGIPAHGVRCLRRVSKDPFVITFGRN